MPTVSLIVECILGRLEEKGTGIFVKYLRSGPLYTCRCPGCGALHGAYRDQGEAAANLKCKQCHLKEVNKFKKEIEKVDDVKPEKDLFKNPNRKEVMGEALMSDEKRVCDSPVFQAWFAGSKAVDSNGSPKLMYHGSSVNIKKFKQGGGELGPGIYFSPEGASANIYARRGHSICAYLKANPYELTAFSPQEAFRLAKLILVRGTTPSTLQGMTAKQLAARISENWHILSGSVRFWLARAGYDAITSLASQIEDQIMVFDRKQIWILNNGAGVAESLLEDEDDDAINAEEFITPDLSLKPDAWTQLDPEKANGTVKFGKMGKKEPLYFTLTWSRGYLYHLHYYSGSDHLNPFNHYNTDPDEPEEPYAVVSATDGDKAIEAAKAKADAFFYCADLSDHHPGRH
jgi:hypothetical protein